MVSVLYSVFLPLNLFISLCLFQDVHCFVPSSSVSLQLVTPKYTRYQSSRIHPLWYRELDSEDDDTDSSMIKVKSRAPIGYDVKKAIQGQYLPSGGPPQSNGINRFLIRALTLNQYLILGIAAIISGVLILVTKGPTGFSDLNDVLQWSGGTYDVFDFTMTPERLLIGIGAAMPLLAVSNIIENSDKRTFANINFSTITMCLSLFGRRNAPPDDFLPAQFKGTAAPKFPTTPWPEAALQSFILSSVTGFCEETVFRRLVPSMIVLLLGGDVNLIVPYIGQGFLFGLGHAQPGNKFDENAVLVGLQTFNGFGLGLLYILTGGDIVPCMICHATYDFVVFFKTWKDANDQMDYADKMYSKPLPSTIESQVRSLIKTVNPTTQSDVAYKILKRMFYLFDFDKNETLSLSEVRKGISYMAIERKAGNPPSQDDVDRLFTAVAQPGESRLTFLDFLRLLELSNKNVRTLSKV